MTAPDRGPRRAAGARRRLRDGGRRARRGVVQLPLGAGRGARVHDADRRGRDGRVSEIGAHGRGRRSLPANVPLRGEPPGAARSTTRPWRRRVRPDLLLRPSPLAGARSGEWRVTGWSRSATTTATKALTAGRWRFTRRDVADPLARVPRRRVPGVRRVSTDDQPPGHGDRPTRPRPLRGVGRRRARRVRGVPERGATPSCSRTPRSTSAYEGHGVGEPTRSGCARRRAAQGWLGRRRCPFVAGHPAPSGVRRSRRELRATWRSRDRPVRPDTYVEAPPHEVFERLRRDDPVHWQDMPDGTGLLGRAAPRRRRAGAPATRRCSRPSSAASCSRTSRPRSLAMMRDMLLAMDPPRHLDHRRNVAPALHAAGDRRARAADPRDLPDDPRRGRRRAASSTSCTTCARELPSQVVGELMGIPREDWPKIHRWSEQNSGGQDPDIAADDRRRRPMERARSRWRCTRSSWPAAARPSRRDDLMTLPARRRGRRPRR